LLVGGSIILDTVSGVLCNGNARVRASGRASRVGRLRWRRTRRGPTTALSLSAPPHKRSPPLVLFPIHFLRPPHPSARTQGTAAPRCPDDDDEHGGGPPFAAQLMEVMVLLHSTHLDHSAHQTPPRSWSWSATSGGSGSLGSAWLSLGPPAPLPASAAAARSSTAMAWIRPLLTRIRRRATAACARGWGEGGGLLAHRWQLFALSRARGTTESLLPPARRAEPVVAPSASDGWFPPSRIVHLRFDFFDVAITIYRCCNWFLQMLHRAYRCLHQCFFECWSTRGSNVANVLYGCCDRSPLMSHLYSLNVAAYNVLMLQSSFLMTESF
jgi:hypothetical protein